MLNDEHREEGKIDNKNIYKVGALSTGLRKRFQNSIGRAMGAETVMGRLDFVKESHL